MNIALFTDTCFPQINGVSNTVDMMVKTLRSQGHQVHIFAPEYEVAIYGSSMTMFQSFPVWFYPDMKVSLFNMNKVRSVCDYFNPDVIHVMTELTIGHMGRNISLERKCPLFTTFTTHVAYYAQLHGLAYLQKPIWSYLKWFHKSAYRVLVPSHSMISELKSQGFQHLQWFKRGVDVHLYNPSHKKQLIDHYDLSQYQCTFLYVGRLSKEKEVEMLIEVFNELSTSLPMSMALFVAGDGPLRKRCEDMANSYVHFLGFQSKSQLKHWYASVDAFVFPSMSETFGNVILEAMASMTLVVGAQQGGVGCILNDSNGVAIDMTIHEHLLEVMKGIVLKHISAQDKVEGMKDTVQEHQWPHLIEGLVLSYQQASVNSQNRKFQHAPLVKAKVQKASSQY
jgi:glycosyltransferase involved in cell wall biosynthesis